MVNDWNLLSKHVRSAESLGRYLPLKVACMRVQIGMTGGINNYRLERGDGAEGYPEVSSPAGVRTPTS